jgi:hypothetical protein
VQHRHALLLVRDLACLFAVLEFPFPVRHTRCTRGRARPRLDKINRELHGIPRSGNWESIWASPPGASYHIVKCLVLYKLTRIDVVGGIK